MASIYSSKDELMEALCPLEPDERAEILKIPANRALALNSGATVTLVEKNGDSIEGTAVYAVQRLKNENPDGISALGGLSEITKMAEKDFETFLASSPDRRLTLQVLQAFADDSKDQGIVNAIRGIDLNTMQVTEDPDFPHLNAVISHILKSGIYGNVKNLKAHRVQELLVGGKDDIVFGGQTIGLTHDIDTIAHNTVRRELAEELGEIHLKFEVDPDRLHLVGMGPIKDDKYILNTWKKGDIDKAKNVYAVNPYCHTYLLSEAEAFRINSQSQQEGHVGEIAALERKSLLEALQGYPNGNPTFDYHYLHEYMTVWTVAAEVLKHDAESLVELAKKVQLGAYQAGKNVPLNFEKMAETMGVEIGELEGAMQVELGTCRRMQEEIERIAAVQQAVVEGRAGGSTGEQRSWAEQTASERSPEHIMTALLFKHFGEEMNTVMLRHIVDYIEESRKVLGLNGTRNTVDKKQITGKEADGGQGWVEKKTLERSSEEIMQALLLQHFGEEMKAVGAERIASYVEEASKVLGVNQIRGG